MLSGAEKAFQPGPNQLLAFKSSGLLHPGRQGRMSNTFCTHLDFFFSFSQVPHIILKQGFRVCVMLSQVASISDVILIYCETISCICFLRFLCTLLNLTEDIVVRVFSCVPLSQDSEPRVQQKHDFLCQHWDLLPGMSYRSGWAMTSPFARLMCFHAFPHSSFPPCSTLEFQPLEHTLVIKTQKQLFIQLFKGNVIMKGFLFRVELLCLCIRVEGNELGMSYLPTIFLASETIPWTIFLPWRCALAPSHTLRFWCDLLLLFSS